MDRTTFQDWPYHLKRHLGLAGPTSPFTYIFLLGVSALLLGLTALRQFWLPRSHLAVPRNIPSTGAPGSRQGRFRRRTDNAFSLENIELVIQRTFMVFFFGLPLIDLIRIAWQARQQREIFKPLLAEFLTLHDSWLESDPPLLASLRTWTPAAESIRFPIQSALATVPADLAEWRRHARRLRRTIKDARDSGSLFWGWGIGWSLLEWNALLSLMRETFQLASTWSLAEAVWVAERTPDDRVTFRDLCEALSADVSSYHQREQEMRELTSTWRGHVPQLPQRELTVAKYLAIALAFEKSGLTKADFVELSRKQNLQKEKGEEVTRPELFIGEFVADSTLDRALHLKRLITAFENPPAP